MNNSLCLGVVSQRIIRAVATAVLLYGYRHTVVWLPPHSCMATATQLYGYRHTVVWRSSHCWMATASCFFLFGCQIRSVRKRLDQWWNGQDQA